MKWPKWLVTVGLGFGAALTTFYASVPGVEMVAGHIEAQCRKVTAVIPGWIIEWVPVAQILVAVGIFVAGLVAAIVLRAAQITLRTATVTTVEV